MHATVASRRAIPEHQPEEYDAIQAIVTAYYMCNAADIERDGKRHYRLAVEDSGSPMTHLANAGRAALRRLEGISYAGGTRIWDEIIKNGENVRHNVYLWRTGAIS